MSFSIVLIWKWTGAWLEFELAYYDVVVLQISHNVTEDSSNLNLRRIENIFVF